MQKSWFLVIGLCSFINLSYALDMRRGPAPASTVTTTLPVIITPQKLQRPPRHPQPSATTVARRVYDDALTTYKKTAACAAHQSNTLHVSLLERLHRALAPTEPSLYAIIAQTFKENERLAASNKTLGAQRELDKARIDLLGGLLLEKITTLQEIKDLTAKQDNAQENLKRIAHLAATALKKL